MTVSVHSKLDIVPITDLAGRGRELHRGIKAYLDGKIFLAPLENPRTILDIGYGTTIIFAFAVSKNVQLIHHIIPLSPQNWFRDMASHTLLSSDSTS